MNIQTFFLIFSALGGISTTMFLMYSGLEDAAGYALLLTFLALIILTPDGKKKPLTSGPQVVGNLVDGIDLSFMGMPGKSYTADVKRCREHFVNQAGQASRMPYSRASYLVRHWRTARGVGGTPKAPSKFRLLMRKVNSWFAHPINHPSFFKKDAE
jgi:hypothetical protein